MHDATYEHEGGSKVTSKTRTKGKKSKKHFPVEDFFTDVKCMCGDIIISKAQLLELDARKKAENWSPERLSKEMNVYFDAANKRHR